MLAPIFDDLPPLPLLVRGARVPPHEHHGVGRDEHHDRGDRERQRLDVHQTRCSFLCRASARSSWSASTACMSARTSPNRRGWPFASSWRCSSSASESCSWVRIPCSTRYCPSVSTAGGSPRRPRNVLIRSI